ncbi:MAG: FTR1 family protein [Burkholderiales bacterium]
MNRLLFCVLLIAAPAFAAEQSVEQRAQTIVHLLDYVSVDYPEFVKDGKVHDEAEYQEQLDFATQVLASLQSLPPVPAKQELAQKARELKAKIEQKAQGGSVAALSGSLRWEVIRAYQIAVAPKAAPDIGEAAVLYAEHCASCHGVQGRGDGRLSVGLDPAPSNFHDGQRMASRSVYGLYNTISLGVAGTAMRGFSGLSENERWALAFHVAKIGIPESQVNEGKRLWEAGEARAAFRDLSDVVTRSNNEISERHGNTGGLVQDYLVAHPQALAANKPSPIAFSRLKLEEASAAYRSGNRAAARELAITAYLEGFELIEASLDNVDRDLRAQVEREMMALRSLIAKGSPALEVQEQVARLDELLAQAEERLSGSLSAGTAFVSSLLILLREGAEAILVLAAIIAFMVKTGRRDALPYVHAGWISALLLGAVTWFAAIFLISISGADREFTEGITALLAAAMLIYVGYWLHGKAYAQGWTRFIREQVGAALGKGTLATMALVSFLAVYREVFEIVLFYQALWVQVKDAGPLLAGIAVAALLLAGIGWAIFKYSVRLPVGPFFAVTSVLIALLAVVFAGNGIAALQETGVVGVNPVDFIALPLLGIYPTAQSLAAQVFALVLVALTFWLAQRESAKPVPI